MKIEREFYLYKEMNDLMTAHGMFIDRTLSVMDDLFQNTDEWYAVKQSLQNLLKSETKLMMQMIMTTCLEQRILDHCENNETEDGTDDNGSGDL